MTNIDDPFLDGPSHRSGPADPSAPADLADLSRTWDALRQLKTSARDADSDRAVLDCAARLAAAPDGESALIWTLGLALMAPYAAWIPGEGVERAAWEALEATDRELRDRPCDHASHPYRIHDAEEDDWHLAGTVRRLAAAEADETAEWEEEQPRDEWLCPRNVAGYARIALDILDPGSVSDVPPRLPAEIQSDIKSLSSVLNLYPYGDPDDDLAPQAWSLSVAGDGDRPGRLLVARAISWHIASGLVHRKSIFDDLIEALEETLPHYAGATCEHAGHPDLENSSPEAAETGLRLSCPAGRAIYERDREDWDNPPLDELLCPARLEEVAEETLSTLVEGRDRIFGDLPTAHLDAEYLRADGRLEIEKIAERLELQGRNEQYADGLGLWAARRHESADARERAVLLLTAHQATQIAYPSPLYAVTRGVLDLMRTVAAAPQPADCAHPDEHPALQRAEFRHGLAHLYAPDEFPPTEHSRSLESWTCPRFAATVAQECIESLEDVYQLDEDEEEEGEGE
ncbi:hypothetical protein OG562_30320 [Streptomyces sp. NBC_01275]|uniref:hypothetical protein n=1 Tax=Streptomyces sp. NBC_01275 TaxID=2903807 RepID=UPI00225C2BC3|nr:hypothetical protein [Streptomyces sp. NBC_01275]MCX4765197.1 hypothetical protein [Streptomyces sp. NBC_01275]